jgi:hypothetical protein
MCTLTFQMSDDSPVNIIHRYHFQTILFPYIQLPIYQSIRLSDYHTVIP